MGRSRSRHQGVVVAYYSNEGYAAFSACCFAADLLLLLGWDTPRHRLVGMALIGQPFFNIFSMSGMILVESFLWIPIVFLLMSTPFRSMDPSLEEAATTAGSSGWQVFQRVTFPLAVPSVLAVMILTMIRSLDR